MQRMHPEDLAELARLVADELAERMGDQRGDAPPAAPARWLSASEVGTMLGINRDAVYRRANELGARRIGSGPKARLRFKAESVEEELAACSVSRGSEDPKPPPRQGSRPRRTIANDHPVTLLPVRAYDH